MGAVFGGGMPQGFTQPMSPGYFRPPGPLVPAPPSTTGLTSILNLIKKGESGGNYNILGMESKPSQNLADMTLNEVMKFGKAAGAYQIIPGTMKGLIKTLGLTGEEKYTPDLQEKMGTALVKARGWDAFKAGKLTPDKFSEGLASEWASLPLISGTNKGQSRYEGDKYGNKANVKVSEVRSALGLG